MKKKILSLLLVLVLAFSSLLFVACGQRQVVTENPVVSEAHNEEPAPAEQAADSTTTAAPATDGFIKFTKGASYTYTGADQTEGSDNLTVTQYGNSIAVTGTVKGQAIAANDTITLSNGKTYYDYKHYVNLVLTSEYRVGNDNAHIASVALWAPILDEDGNPTSNYGFDDGDDDYADVDVEKDIVDDHATLTINVNKISALKIKVTFNDENETAKEYTIDLSQLRSGKSDNITKSSPVYKYETSPESEHVIFDDSFELASDDIAFNFEAYDAEDEEYKEVLAYSHGNIEVNQYNKELIISGTLPYYKDASSEFGAGYIVALKIESAERLAANAKSVYSVSGGDAKLYNNQDLHLLDELYKQIEEEEHTNANYDPNYFYLVWRMDKGNTAPLTLKVTWADYAVEQTYTITLASDIAYALHDDGITKITPETQEFHRLGKYVDGDNVLKAKKNHQYDGINFKYDFDPDDETDAAAIAPAVYTVQQYDSSIKLTSTKAIHYSVFEGKAVGYGAQLTFTYVGNNDEFEIGEKFQVKEDGKVIYSWDAENEVAESAYGSDYNLNSNNDSFEYFPVFNAKGESHTVEVTWYEGCTVSYTITFAPTDLGQYGDWITTFEVESITDVGLFMQTSAYKAAVAAEADLDLEMTSAEGAGADLAQYGKTITVNGAKLPYIDFTEIELEDGYYIALHLTPNDVKQRPVEAQLVVKLDGKEVDVLGDGAILIRLSQANESHKVSVQWNSDVVEQEYTVNFVNNYFLTIEE